MLCYTSVGTLTWELMNTHPTQKNTPTCVHPCCTSSSLALPCRHPLPSPSSSPPAYFEVQWLVGCVSFPDFNSLTHSLTKFPFLFFHLAQHTFCSFTTQTWVCIHHTLWPSVSAECISTLPFSVSSQASPCSDLFRCVVASRVCVRLWPCPVKYRLFKEVSSIIWPLYCNYKVLLLEIAHRESYPQALAGSTSLSWCHHLRSLCRHSRLNVIHPWSLACSDPDVATSGSQVSCILVTLWYYSLLSTRFVWLDGLWEFSLKGGHIWWRFSSRKLCGNWVFLTLKYQPS